jgi:hypothetical protein
MTKFQEWIKESKWNEFAKVLELPIVQEALEVLEESAKPNASVATSIVREAQSAELAQFQLSFQHACSSGQQQAVNFLRRIGRPIEPKDDKSRTPQNAPYDWINESNYEQFLTR